MLYIEFIILLFIATFLVSCEKKTELRHYQEIVKNSAVEKIDPHHGLDIPALMKPMGNNSMDMNKQSAEVQAMIKSSIVNLPIRWVTPDQWIETKGSGMRLVSFVTQEDDPIDCSIVALGGVAGGLDANLSRWLGQINLGNIDQNQFEKFKRNYKPVKTTGGLIGQIYDFTELQNSKDNNTPSIMGAIFKISNQSVFIKMTGSKSAIIRNRSKFIQLCESINLNE